MAPRPINPTRYIRLGEQSGGHRLARSMKCENECAGSLSAAHPPTHPPTHDHVCVRRCFGSLGLAPSRLGLVGGCVGSFSVSSDSAKPGTNTGRRQTELSCTGLVREVWGEEGATDCRNRCTSLGSVLPGREPEGLFSSSRSSDHKQRSVL